MIRHIVTLGYGNGTFAGDIGRTVTLGYGISAVTETVSIVYVVLSGTPTTSPVIKGVDQYPSVAGIDTDFPVFRGN